MVTRRSLNGAAALGLACVALSACVTDDPNRGGFFGGLAGLNNGAYEAGSEERRQRLADLQQVNADLGRQEERMRGELADNHHQQALLRRTIAGLKTASLRLDAEARRIGKGALAVRQDLADAESRRQMVAREIADLDRRIAEHRITYQEALERKAALEREIADLQPIYRLQR